MSRKKICEEVCAALVKINEFKYTYKELMKFMEKVEEKRKKKKNNIEDKKLEKYREFIKYYRNEGYNLKDTLELWEKKIKN